MKNISVRKNIINTYLISCLLVLFTTLFGELFKKKLEPTNIVMFYLLVIVFVAVRWGRGPAVATSLLSVLAFDFFLIPPYLTLEVADIEYLFTFAAFLVVGIVVSTFADKVRRQIMQQQTEKLHSALLSSISHDLKTPLVSITGALSALLDKRANLGEPQKSELLKAAAEESGRLNRIVDNLLDMTRMESGVLRISKKPCDLRDLIGSCLEQLNDKIGDREISIRIPNDFPEISIDLPFMLKALFNLVDNALKYSAADSSIKIQAILEQPKVQIKITDSGCGIAREDLKRIFEKFYRAQQPQNVSGTGLGLCISKGIIEAHGGMIYVESIPGKGSTFTVELPLT